MAFSVAKDLQISIGSGHAKTSASSRRRCRSRIALPAIASTPSQARASGRAANAHAGPAREQLSAIRAEVLTWNHPPNPIADAASRQVGELAQIGFARKAGSTTRNAVHWKGTTEARKSGIRQAQ